MARNPNWTRDEVILALDLYFRLDPFPSSAGHPEVVALSDLLNALPIHRASEKDERFRNPSGVYMKLGNFLSLDPDYEGKGLYASSSLDRAVWDKYASDRARLSRVASAIRANYDAVASSSTVAVIEEVDEEVFAEGRVLTRVHKARERNTRVVNKKKGSVIKRTGRLACEACGFDFYQVYGERGQGFAECHHLVPLSEIDHRAKTKLSDLAILCANCHRMIHRGERTLTIDELRQIVDQQAG